MALDIEKEKKKNVKIAIGVAALGISAFVVLYILMFALMFLKPGFMFSIMPIPALSKNIASINDKLYVISREVDFTGLSFESKKEPKEKFMLGILEDKKISDSREVKPFHSLANGNNKIYFFGEGFYRTFDGVQSVETQTKAIGKRPKAAISPEGLFVLSEIKNNPALNLIKEDEISSIPLPEEYLSDKKNRCSTQLLWFQGKLYLSWPSDEQLHWISYDGKDWNASEPSEYQGSVKMIADNKIIYLFNEHVGEWPNISLTVYENGAWKEPKDLNVKGLFIDWSPIIHHGKLLLFVRSFFSEELYAIENSNAVNPIKINSSFFGKGFFWKISRLIIFANLIAVFFVFLLSVFINKFKLKTWKTDSAEYEFASLFRRFLAKTIDTFIVMLPVLTAAIYFITYQNFWTNPFRFILAGLLAFIYLILANFLYHSLLEGIYGKTIGKKICGIVVLKDDFSKCGLLAGFLRNIMRLVDNFFYYFVGIVSMTGTLKWQRLGDVVAGTVVVREKKA